jgi:hypothetical protein
MNHLEPNSPTLFGEICGFLNFCISKRIEEAAVLWAFLAQNLGMKLPKSFGR